MGKQCPRIHSLKRRPNVDNQLAGNKNNPIEREIKLLMDEVINIERQIPMNSLQQPRNIPVSFPQTTGSFPQTTGAGGSGHPEPIYYLQSLPPTPHPVIQPTVNTNHTSFTGYQQQPEVQPVQSFRNQNQSVTSGNLHYQPNTSQEAYYQPFLEHQQQAYQPIQHQYI